MSARPRKSRSRSKSKSPASPTPKRAISSFTAKRLAEEAAEEEKRKAILEEERRTLWAEQNTQSYKSAFALSQRPKSKHDEFLKEMYRRRSIRRGEPTPEEALNYEEFKEAVVDLAGIDVTEDKIREFFAWLDKNGDARVQYSEFAAAASRAEMTRWDGEQRKARLAELKKRRAAKKKKKKKKRRVRPASARPASARRAVPRPSHVVEEAPDALLSKFLEEADASFVPSGPDSPGAHSAPDLSSQFASLNMDSPEPESAQSDQSPGSTLPPLDSSLPQRPPISLQPAPKPRVRAARGSSSRRQVLQGSGSRPSQSSSPKTGIIITPPAAETPMPAIHKLTIG